MASWKGLSYNHSIGTPVVLTKVEIENSTTLFVTTLLQTCRLFEKVRNIWNSRWMIYFLKANIIFLEECTVSPFKKIELHRSVFMVCIFIYNVLKYINLLFYFTSFNLYSFYNYTLLSLSKRKHNPIEEKLQLSVEDKSVTKCTCG
jgi:hypothetical protein